MASIEKVVFHTAEEIEFITAETITADASTASHLDKLDRQIKALKLEREAIAKALFDKWEHKKPENNAFHVSIYDYYKLDENKLKTEDEDTYNKYKTKLIHVEKVTG